MDAPAPLLLQVRLQPRRIGRINRLGLWTLAAKEVKRFLKVWVQTLAAPVITALLFYAVFALALGGAERTVHGVPYMEFLAPGLIMMSMVQNAFANTSSSIVISKVQGNIVDVLMPPLGPGELVLGWLIGGLARGLAVGLLVGGIVYPFLGLSLASPLLVLFHAVVASMLLSLIGIVGGIWSEKFDHIAFVTNFIVTPLAFLSGTFYSIHDLPGPWQVAAHFDPFFYMIDGFRAGFIGSGDSPWWLGVSVLSAANLMLFLLALRMVKTGYRLKP